MACSSWMSVKVGLKPIHGSYEVLCAHKKRGFCMIWLMSLGEPVLRVCVCVCSLFPITLHIRVKWGLVMQVFQLQGLKWPLMLSYVVPKLVHFFQYIPLSNSQYSCCPDLKFLSFSCLVNCRLLPFSFLGMIFLFHVVILLQGFSCLQGGICVSSMGRPVSYERAVAWKVLNEEETAHCIAFMFVNWSFVWNTSP